MVWVSAPNLAVFQASAVAQGLLFSYWMNNSDVCSSLVPLDEELGETQVHQFGKAQILIAEDNPTVAQELKCRLESLDYEVAGITHSAEQAVALAERLKPG